MDKNLVSLDGHEPRVGTWKLSQGFQIAHRSLKQIIEKYKENFERLGNGILKSRDLEGLSPISNRRKSKEMGRPKQEYWLSEMQSTFLITLLRNNETVISFKEHVTKEFFKMRRLLSNLIINQKNEEWLLQRKEGKIDRKQETDEIKKFIEYARQQGSSSSDKYYLAITKMENKALFHLEVLEMRFPNLREVINLCSLRNLQMADRIVARALEEGISLSMNYKEIFQLAKQRVELFASVIGKIDLEKVIADPKLLN